MSVNVFNKIIENYLKRNGSWTRMKGELAVFYWPKIAGFDLAQKVEAVRYQDGALFLKTDNPALAHQLTLMSMDIVKRYQKVLGRGVIRNIKLKVAPIQITAEEKKVVAPELPLNHQEEWFIQECAQEIKDPDLEARFTQMMRKSLQNTKRKEMEGYRRCARCGTLTDKHYSLCCCCQYRTGDPR